MLKYFSKLKKSQRIKNTKDKDIEILSPFKSFTSYENTDYAAPPSKENQDHSAELITQLWQDASTMVPKNQKIPTLSIFIAC